MPVFDSEQREVIEPAAREALRLLASGECFDLVLCDLMRSPSAPKPYTAA